MRYMIILATALVASVSLQACTSVSSLQGRDMATTAPSQIFEAAKPAVETAVVSSIENLGYNLKEVKKAEPTTQIYFSKSMSAFSWGEVGRVDVTRVGDTHTVLTLDSETRYKLQITGTSEKDFAKQIFAEVRKSLQK